MSRRRRNRVKGKKRRQNEVYVKNEKSTSIANLIGRFILLIALVFGLPILIAVIITKLFELGIGWSIIIALAFMALVMYVLDKKIT